jgi:hypothetical protein
MLRGWLWIRFLLLLAVLRLYPLLRRILISLTVPAELLVECGDHDGRVRYRDLPWTDTHGRPVRPDTRHD